MFQSGAGSSNGLMTVGAQVASPMMLSPSAQQSRVSDQAQAQLLQSYLDRHAQGAAFSSADNWMPMLRSTPAAPWASFSVTRCRTKRYRGV